MLQEIVENLERFRNLLHEMKLERKGYYTLLDFENSNWRIKFWKGGNDVLYANFWVVNDYPIPEDKKLNELVFSLVQGAEYRSGDDDWIEKTGVKSKTMSYYLPKNMFKEK